LFTAYAIVLSNTRATGAGALVDWDTRLLLLRAIPAIAIISAVIILLGILSGYLAMRDVRRLTAANVAEAVQRRLPPLQGRCLTRTLGIAAPIACRWYLGLCGR
jgi:xanthosine utilization system XapX-like protein